ncbi:MYXO-CTERM sorting domain-containing protein [Myxococcus sp. Y35]|uniref:MYXO-CTERM sorting domain-containing protein n=1 Tax=Pseudomyxococcus flavus TaxID=3115648 RepID=UPI003CF33F6D
MVPLPAVKLKSFDPGASAIQMLAFDDLLLAGVDPGSTNLELWRSDGTAEGTQRIHLGVHAEEGRLSMAKVGARVLFTSGNSLWSTDGLDAGTTQVASLPFYGFRVESTGPYAFLVGDTPNKVLWRTDGTALGTHEVPNQPSSIEGFAVVHGRGWFNAPYFAGEPELWLADATPGGQARFLKDIIPGPLGSIPNGFVPLGSLTFFRATERTIGGELWKSDGTPDGTVRVTEAPGPAETVPVQLFPWKGHVYYWALGLGGTLYRSDGTMAGTHQVSAQVSSGEGGFLGWGDFLFVSAVDDTGDHELWRTDGTPEGTVRVADLNPGTASSAPASLVLMSEDGPLVFVATTPDAGRELWRLDSPSGTPTLAADVAAGAASSSPANLTIVGTDLYFTAHDGTSSGLFVLSGLIPGPEVDGGTDAGSECDAGAEPDAGSEMDAGTEPDAGTGVDAGSEADGGAEPDAGTGHDAGAEPDAGSTQDAGATDGGTGEPPPGGGCGCQSTPASVPWSLALLGLIVTARRRSRAS